MSSISGFGSRCNAIGNGLLGTVVEAIMGNSGVGVGVREECEEMDGALDVAVAEGVGDGSEPVLGVLVGR